MYWLLFNTTICRYIVDICYSKNRYDDNKKRRYTIEFNHTDRYIIEISQLSVKKNIRCLLEKSQPVNQSKKFDSQTKSSDNTFKCNILKGDQHISTIQFSNPNDLCYKLFNHKNSSIRRFVRLVLDNSGFHILLSH